MATYTRHMPTTAAKYAAANIQHASLDCAVNYIHQIVLGEHNVFNFNFVFRYGMPGKFPMGKWGYTMDGDIGVRTRAKPNPGDHRTTDRGFEIPRYHVEFGSINRVMSLVTEYYERDYQEQLHPYEVIQRHLVALRKALPMYHLYLIYKIFAGAEFKKQNTYIKDWLEHYIEPSDGAQQGYPFYLSEGVGEVNLQAVINKKKITQHPLKTNLESIAGLIRKEANKIEVDIAQEPKLQKAIIKQSLTPESQKTLALFLKTRAEALKVIRNGMFDVKYTNRSGQGVAKFKTDKGEEVDYNDKIRIPVTSSDLIVIMNKAEWEDFQLDKEYFQPAQSGLAVNSMPGRLIFSDIIDKGEALILHKDFVQIWVIPLSVEYQVFDHKYLSERTRDYMYAFDHSLDVIPFHGCMWVKMKAA